jgi:glucuronokinase
LTSTGTAYARAALAGNPSDGYGGGVLAVCVANFAATVELVAPRDAEQADAEECLRVEPAAAAALVGSAAARHATATGRTAPRLRATVRTTIPREVGLAGSSAIVIATLRALDTLHETRIPREHLPVLALAAEADLGITAGLQDRVAQAYGGLTAMTFGLDGSFRARRLEGALLPPLILAWDARGAAASGVYHGDLRARWEAGEPLVHRVMAALRDHAADAAEALERGDADALGAAMDASYDLRASLGPLDPRHVELVEAAHRHGLPVNFAGSGGAVVALCIEPDRLTALREELERRGCRAEPVRLPPPHRCGEGAKAGVGHPNPPPRGPARAR